MNFYEDTDKLQETVQEARRVISQYQDFERDTIITVSKVSPKARSSFYGFSFPKANAYKVGDIFSPDGSGVSKVVYIIPA